MKTGDILYRVLTDVGFGPWSRHWDEECATKDVERPSVTLETWRVNSISNRVPHRHPTLGAWGEPVKMVFIRRFDHGAGVRMKTKGGKVVGFTFDKNRTKYDSLSLEAEKVSEEFRPSKKGAYRAAAARVRKGYFYKREKDKSAYEKLRSRLIKKAESLK